MTSCRVHYFQERGSKVTMTQFPLHLWLAKPTLSSQANIVSQTRYNAR
jgi:hypothetical protein